jgi:hypothetical protein
MKELIEIDDMESIERFSIPSDKMSELPSDKPIEHKPESVSEAVVGGAGDASLSLGVAFIGLLLSLTGIGIIIGLPLIIIGVVGAFGITKDAVKDSVELMGDKK